VFVRTFVLAGQPTSGWIDIAVDDSAEIRVNGQVVGSIGRGSYGSLTRFDLLAFLGPGRNTIAVKATNGPWCGTCPFSQNPAGIVFGARSRCASKIVRDGPAGPSRNRLAHRRGSPIR
jgi:hypothetical protein